MYMFAPGNSTPHFLCNPLDTVLLGISKRGDSYLRTLLIHGARAVVTHVKGKDDPRSQWINRLKARSSVNAAAVAIANKNARLTCAMLAAGLSYQPGAGGQSATSAR